MYGWSGICIFHKMKRKRKKKRSRTRWRLSTKREMSVIWLFFSMKRDSFYVFIWEKWFLVIVIRVVVFFFIHILLRDSEWWIQNLSLGETVMRNATVYDPLIDQDIISYPRFSIFLESGTSYDSILVDLFSSMWSWMSGWDPTTWKFVPTHPSNHMK